MSETGKQKQDAIVKDAATGIETSQENAGTAALQAGAMAREQARFVMAYRRPRDVMQFRQKLLLECGRPGFAEVATYVKPVGKEKNEVTGEWEEKYAEGPSIRFMETAARLYGNLTIERQPTHDDATKRIWRVEALDLENNFSESINVVVEKVAERRKAPKPGVKLLGTRYNTWGDLLYLIEPTADQFKTMELAAIAKAEREMKKKLMPADLVAEAQRVCFETIEKKIKEDPDAALRRMLDGFAELRILPAALSEYLGGVPVETVTPAQLRELRFLFAALRDGEVTWIDALAASPHIQRAPTTGADGKEKDPAGQALRDKLTEAGKRPKGKAPPPSPDDSKPAPAPAPSDAKPADDGSDPAEANRKG